MTSKFGMKTYSRQKVCQSNIQFDQLFNDKSNKPTAAKSKGTLHRWGMTSFTSVRNTPINGRKETIGREDNVKRRKVEHDIDDPFSFDSEPDGGLLPSKTVPSAPAAIVNASSNKNLGNASKTNKFFKSGSSRSAFKLKQTSSGDTKSSQSALPKSNEDLIPNNNEPHQEDKPRFTQDAFSQLLLSTGVTSATESPIDMCLSSLNTGTMFSSYTLSQNVHNYSTTSNVVPHSFGYEQSYFSSQQPLVDNSVHPNVFFASSPAQHIVNSVAPRTYSHESKVDLIMKDVGVSIGDQLTLGNKPDSVVFDSALLNLEEKTDLTSDHVLDSRVSDSTLLAAGNQLEAAYKSQGTVEESVAYSTEKLNMIDGATVCAVLDNVTVNTGGEINSSSKPCDTDFNNDDHSLEDKFSVPNKTLTTAYGATKTLETGYEAVRTLETGYEAVKTLETGYEAVKTLETGYEAVKMLETGYEAVKTLERGYEATKTLTTTYEVNELYPEDKLNPTIKSEDSALESRETNLCVTDIPAYINKSDYTDSEEDSIGFAKQSSASVTSLLTGTESYSESPVDPKLHLDDSQESLPKEDTSEEVKSHCSTSNVPYRTLSVLRQRRIFNSPKKVDKRALYKHRPWQMEEEPVPEEEIHMTCSQPTLAEEFDELCDEDTSRSEKPTLTRVTTWPTRVGEDAITSVKCPKKFKELYAVVKNVKQAHQCHESGETQEFNDDIEYLLDSLQGTNSVGTRCLSILSLAGKCMAPSFRMHLRAHGSLTKVFSALHDAPKDPNLSLCTATVMFILSQDRLNMDLERSSLELMLQLLETETCLSTSSIICSSTNGHNREFDKNKEKVRELCDQLQKKGSAKQIDLDNITAGVLAMETLLSLTSRRAGEWFKEELRELGGLDHLVNTVSECGKCLPTAIFQLSEFALDKLRKLDRCLRVLENVTAMNSQNQSYLISCHGSSLIYYCSRAIKLCESCLKIYPTPENSDRDSPSWVLYSCLISVMKVLLNLTNENPVGSSKVGEQEGLIASSLACVIELPPHLDAEQRFDLLVLSLGLLINLVEYCEYNRKRVFYASMENPQKSSYHSRRAASTITAPKALVNLFMEHEEAARVEEAKTDNLLDGKGDADDDCNNVEKPRDDNPLGPQCSQDDIEETLKKALQKAGKNMEDSMIAAYIALLLGCIIQDNRDNANKIRDHLPNKDFNIMVQILKKFLNFMNLTNIVGSTGMKSIQRVINILEAT